jgi:hypothetical protein
MDNKKENLPEVFHSVVKEPIMEVRLTQTDLTHLCGLLHRFANGLPNSEEVAGIAAQFYKSLKHATRV